MAGRPDPYRLPLPLDGGVGGGPGPGAPLDPENGTDWSEVGADDELMPGDMGQGIADLEARGRRSPSAVRRVPVSFSAIVLLLTLTVGIGLSAGLLAGPSPFHFPGTAAAPGTTTIANNSSGTPTPGTSNGSGGSNPPPDGSTPGPNQTLPNATVPNGTAPGPHNSTPTQNCTGTNATEANCTGNATSPGHNCTNQTLSELPLHRGLWPLTNCSGNSSGPEQTRGNQSNNPGPTNRSSPPPTHRAGTPNGTVVVIHADLPSWPSLLTTGALVFLGVVASLGGLAAAMFVESLRPPKDEENPWIGQSVPGRARRRRRPRVSPREALEAAVLALRAELVRYGQARVAVDTEVRARIIELYAAVLAAVGPGLGDLSGRTPREVEWLSVQYLGVAPATAHELTWLFEEARYSTHRLPPSGVDRAQHALNLLVSDLERRSWNL